jgi:pyruvate dehydrogenase E2 component (dihydrolipoamide acetyltransferase)
MAIEIKLPELGENVEGGDVVDVKVAVGANVHDGQALLEVEAEKSTVEVPSPGSGRISKVLVKRGDAVKTGQTLFLMETEGADSTPPPDKGAAPAKASPPLSETKAEPPPTSARLPSQATKTAQAARAPVTASGAGRDGVHAAESTAINPAGPATRRLARELGVDLARVPGTAPGGRVTQEDVKAFVKEWASGAQQPASHVAVSPIIAPPLPDFTKWGPVERQALDSVRRKTAQQVSLSWSLIPHVTHHDLADITELEGFRKQQDSQGPKLTVTAFALKATAIALKQFPRFNASLDLANNQLLLKQYYHLGLAVDTEHGLLVPVLRDADIKSVHDLAKEMAEVADKARQKKLTADDMRGGTFTITNLGGIGGTAFTPIINYPEVAILGISRGRLQPVYHDNAQVTPRLMLPLSLSYDHRVIDGADAARFVRYIVDMLENPLVMLLHA